MTGSQEQTPEQHPVHVLGRRSVVAAVGTAGLVAALSACGDSDGGSSGSGSDKVEGGASSGQDGASGGGDTGGGSTGGESPSGKVLGKTSDIPEGGGKVFASERVVVTQPKAGEFKAFSATCTHQGCLVKKVADGTIDCPCHGSRFDVSDGSVKGGPAPRPLPPAKIEVSDGSIRLA